MSWIAVGIGAAGTVAGMVGSSNAAKKQQGASNAAIAAQQAQYNQNRTDNLPALDARNNALMMLQQKAGQYGMAPTSEQVMSQPGYQFGLTQGNNNIQNSAAAGGGLYSGAAMKALTRYGNDYATTKFDTAFNQMQTSQNNDFNRYNAIAQDGQNGANTIANAGQNMANNASNMLNSNAANQGAASIAQGNLLAGGLNQLGSWANSKGGQSSLGQLGDNVGGWWAGTNANGSKMSNASTYIDPTSLYAQNGSDLGYKVFAEGGPVRDPVIGTRTALPQGNTGGGMDRNALLRMLLVQQAAQQPQVRGNFLTHPGQILDARMQQAGAFEAGGPVHGPGGPKDDQIPAMLSNGEHVMDAASVNAIGSGSNDRGQNRLNALRKAVKGAR